MRYTVSKYNKRCEHLQSNERTSEFPDSLLSLEDCEYRVLRICFNLND